MGDSVPFRNPITTLGGILTLPALQSPDFSYTPSPYSVAGWKLSSEVAGSQFWVGTISADDLSIKASSIGNERVNLSRAALWASADTLITADSTTINLPLTAVNQDGVGQVISLQRSDQSPLSATDFLYRTYRITATYTFALQNAFIAGHQALGGIQYRYYYGANVSPWIDVGAGVGGPLLTFWRSQTRNNRGGGSLYALGSTRLTGGGLPVTTYTGHMQIPGSAYLLEAKTVARESPAAGCYNWIASRMTIETLSATMPL